VVVHIENDKWCRQVLQKYFRSGIERYKSGNIRDVKVLAAGVKVLLVTPPCVDSSAIIQFRVSIHDTQLEGSPLTLFFFKNFLAKLYHKPTTYFSNPLKPSPRIQKKYKKTPLRARDISSVYFQLHAITSLQYSE